MSEQRFEVEAERPKGDRPRTKRLSISQLILISLALGVLAGLFFGEDCRRLQVLGDAFVALLQMTILPYIVVSLIGNIGGLKPKQAKILAGHATTLQLTFWAVVVALICITPLGLPDLTQKTFFSTSAITPSGAFDLLSYIPSNPFRSLSDNVVPAAVIFSIAVGIALIPIQEKDGLISGLNVLSKAMVKVGGAVAKTTPLGVFALTASAAGTMTVDDLNKTQAYLLLYAVGCLLLTFLIMPAAVAAITPFGFRSIIRHTKDAMVVGFTTANPLIALPLMITGAQALFREYEMEGEEVSQTIETVIPIIYSFPNVAKLLMIVFIPFAGWYSGQPLSALDYPSLTITGVLTFFGSVTVAIPYLLDMFKLPSDLFNIFMVANTIIIGRVAALGAVMHLVALGLMVTCITHGSARFHTKRLLTQGAVSVLMLIALLIGSRVYLASVLGGEYTMDETVETMDFSHPPRDPRHEPRVLPAETPPRPLASDMSLLAQILARVDDRWPETTGVLRVGYTQEAVPYSYTRQAVEGETRAATTQLVGLNVELMIRLAEDMDVALELVPIPHGRIEASLGAGLIDLSIAPLAITPSSLKAFALSDPYLDLTGGLIVKDYRRKAFDEVHELVTKRDLKIGVVTPHQEVEDYYVRTLRRQLPNARITPVKITQVEAFFDHALIDEANPVRAAELHQLDALFMTGEDGTVWTLKYPDYSVVFPNTKRPMKMSYGFPVANDPEWMAYLNHWIHFQKQNGTLQRLVNHWLYGRNEASYAPRWSIWRDVLGVGEDDPAAAAEEAVLQ